MQRFNDPAYTLPFDTILLKLEISIDEAKENDLLATANSLTSVPGAVAMLQNGIEETRDRFKDIGSNTRQTIDAILERGPHRHSQAILNRGSLTELSAEERALTSQAAEVSR